MSLVKWAIFGLLMLPFAEIAVFVVVGLKIGFLAAIALMVLTSMAGMWVIRHAGHREVARVRSAFGDRVITRTELDGPGFLTVLGGFLLVLPGFITDVLGALLLLPLTRRLLGCGTASRRRRCRAARGRTWSICRPISGAMFRTSASNSSAIPGRNERFPQPCPAACPRVSHTADCAGAPAPMPQEHVHGINEWRPRRRAGNRGRQAAAAQRSGAIHQGSVVREPERAALAAGPAAGARRSTSRSTSTPSR